MAARARDCTELAAGLVVAGAALRADPTARAMSLVTGNEERASGRTDMWWPVQRVAGEADGHATYDGRFREPLSALRAREERDRRLHRRGARAVAHWS